MCESPGITAEAHFLHEFLSLLSLLAYFEFHLVPVYTETDFRI